jgi:hypothetical protein
MSLLEQSLWQSCIVVGYRSVYILKALIGNVHRYIAKKTVQFSYRIRASLRWKLMKTQKICLKVQGDTDSKGNIHGKSFRNSDNSIVFSVNKIISNKSYYH